MKPIFTLIVILLVSFAGKSQSFQKGSVLISVSEGSTWSHFVTLDESTKPEVFKDDHIHGDRDPLIVEYGINNQWGVGINMGGDVFHFSPANFYQVTTNDQKIITSELSLEGNYHFYETAKWDLAACVSLGFAGVNFSGTNGDGRTLKYNAGGGIARLSAKGRYYVTRRLGVLCILGAYASSCRPDPNKDNSVARYTTTNISGYSIEFGLCYRVRR